MVPAGLRERKKATTKAALAEHALTLFAAQGFERTTVDEIAAACEVSTRTFFRYFTSKEDVLWASASQRTEELLAAFEARPPDEAPLVALRRAMLSMCPSYERQRQSLRRRREVIRSTSSLRGWTFERQTMWIAALMGSLRSRPGRRLTVLEARVVTGAVAAALTGAVETWLDSNRQRLGPFIDAAFDLLESGLSVSTGAA